ncbi:hypothetical protein QBC47DRAFT_399673 [Echria macrotheca]|uniref:Protein YAE1 n=1 Tax=Echria macrotheca TaxID=438768 RepID=A0AAJ0FD82_9PEZI|nr:hypothetical protein QBC47DRAFT_399673 [Echria macrotheca]
MLLHNNPLQNDDIFPAMSTSHTPHRSPSPIPDHNHTTTQDTTTTTTNNNLDDVWGDDDDNNNEPHHHQHHPQNLHSSDIPRLQHDHSTAGYRDGIALAKASSVQAGFDEGYSLGATIGLRAGKVLGVLEGLVFSFSSSSSSSSSSHTQESERLRGLLEDARRELDVRRIFSGEYWGEDGIWRYDVVGEGDRDGEGVVFGDVAGGHPLIQKWEGVVRMEGGRWGVDWDVLRGEEGEREGEGDEAHRGYGHGVERKGEVKAKAAGRGALEW